MNQGKSLSHIKIRHAYDFSLCFSRELLMIFEGIVLMEIFE